MGCWVQIRLLVVRRIRRRIGVWDGEGAVFDGGVAKMRERMRFAGLGDRAVCMEKMNVLDKVRQ